MHIDKHLLFDANSCPVASEPQTRCQWLLWAT
jgi:hypothetical protein